MPAPAVRIRRITRRFAAASWPRRRPPVTALDDVTLDIAPGAIAGLLGPNGAGKTSLLEILATVLLPTSGTALIDDHDVVRDAPRVRAQIAYCPAGAAAFFPRLTGRQNLEFFLALADVPPASADARVSEAAALAGLAADLDRDLRGYSDGMRQRLSIACALAIDARLWLFDEPTRSLDPAAQQHLREAIRALAAARGATVLVATHDLSEAAEICDEVILLQQGRVGAVGRPADLAAAHGSLRAAYDAVIGAPP